MMSIDEIYDTIEYEVKFRNGEIIRGNIDYVTSHLNDDYAEDFYISDTQPAKLVDFVKFLKEYNKSHDGKLDIMTGYSYYIRSK